MILLWILAPFIATGVIVLIAVQTKPDEFREAKRRTKALEVLERQHGGQEPKWYVPRRG